MWQRGGWCASYSSWLTILFPQWVLRSFQIRNCGLIETVQVSLRAHPNKGLIWRDLSPYKDVSYKVRSVAYTAKQWYREKVEEQLCHWQPLIIGEEPTLQQTWIRSPGGRLKTLSSHNFRSAAPTTMTARLIIESGGTQSMIWGRLWAMWTARAGPDGISRRGLPERLPWCTPDFQHRMHH